MLKAKKNVLKKKTASAKSVAKQRKATLAQKLAPNGFNSKVAVAFQRLEKVEKGIKAMMMNHKPPAGASRQVVSTHHLPPHKMYDPELGMWTFPYRAIARTSVSPTGTVVAPSNVDPTNPLNLGLIDLGNGGSLLSGSPLPITSSQLMLAFTPSNGNQSPLQLLKNGNENSVDITLGWSTPSLWDTVPFLPNMAAITEQHRIVNASLKVTYTGTSLANSGTVYVYQGPHIPQFHKSGDTMTKLSVAQMVSRVRTHARTIPYDVEDFRGGKIFHVERGTQRRVFRAPYTATFPDSSYGNKIFTVPAQTSSDSTVDTSATPVTTDAPAYTTPSVETSAGRGISVYDPGTAEWTNAQQALGHTHVVQVSGNSVTTVGEPMASIPPTMQALYLFAEGLSLSGSNFLVEAVQQAEIQIDPDATGHIGLQTPPNNHLPEPDANANTVHNSKR
jgi:hypothetical protein